MAGSTPGIALVIDVTLGKRGNKPRVDTAPSRGLGVPSASAVFPARLELDSGASSHTDLVNWPRAWALPSAPHENSTQYWSKTLSNTSWRPKAKGHPVTEA
jgi:hypothetical protein